jgi:hypothetical protein
MRTALLLTLVACSSKAEQPPPQQQPDLFPGYSKSNTPVSSSCPVTVAVAPDAMRPALEGKLRMQPRCRPLEARVIVTEGGLMVIAAEPGRPRRQGIEQTPDAAAELIVQWATMEPK